MSWLTRSKNFSRSTSTTTRQPACTYCCASNTAPCALRPGRKPWLCSLNVGSMSGCSTCSSACWINLSTTVGIPSSRIPPPGLGMPTRRTGSGRYLPSSNRLRMSGHACLRYSPVSCTVRPSTPALPLLAFTRFHARAMFSLASACPSRSPAPQSVCACRANVASSLTASDAASPRPAPVRLDPPLGFASF